MAELTTEQQAWVNTQLESAVRTYTQEREGGPNGRWVSEKKSSLELQCQPLSEIIRRMIKIGHPENIHNREPQKAEFETLARELDRREQSYKQRA